MADGNPQSRYVKLTREQEAPTEDINPGELNQPIQIPQVLLSLPGLRIFLQKIANLGSYLRKMIMLDVGFLLFLCFHEDFFYLVAT